MNDKVINNNYEKIIDKHVCKVFEKIQIYDIIDLDISYLLTDYLCFVYAICMSRWRLLNETSNLVSFFLLFIK